MKRYSALLESLPAKTTVFAFGRFNPPTTGHELLVKLVKKLAQSNSADHAIYASATQDKKKNPLSVDRKIHYLNLMFPSTHFYAAGGDQRTFIEVAKHLNKKYKNLIMVAGSDRVPEYQKLLDRYNGTEFHFDSVKVMSAGERDPDADDASGMSASKMRAAASKGDYATFKRGLPSTVRDLDGRRLMNEIRTGMGLETVKEQIKFEFNALREAYINKQIFNIGDIVESAGVEYEIVDRGTNYLTVVDHEGQTHRKWLHECVVVGVVEDVTPGYAPSEISFKGYTTKNLHHSEDAAKAFQSTIERYGKSEPATVLTALKATDAYMKLNDMHLEQGKAPDDQEIKAWRDAHGKARDSLNRIGEFLHHEDYWHMHEHEIQDMENKYTPATAGAEMSDSYQPDGTQLDEALQAHKVNVTVSDPNHPAVTQRKEQILKRVIVKATDKGDARAKAEAFYKKKGYKVHDSEWHSVQPASSMKTEEFATEELTDKTIRSSDKIKVARVIADMLGVENAESMSPDTAVNMGLRKIKNKRMTPELTGVVKKMLQLAKEVGIKVDASLVPQAISEDVVNKNTTYNVAKDVLRYKDFVKLKKMNNEEPTSVTDTDDVDPNDEDDIPGPNTGDNAPSATKIAAKDLEHQNVPATTVGHSLDGQGDAQLRRRKVAYKMEEVDLDEDLQSADYKISPSGRKYRARHIMFKNSDKNSNPIEGDDEHDGEDEIKKVSNRPLFKKIREQVEDDVETSEQELNDIAKDVDDVDDILDVYDDNEIVIVDADSGEVVDHMQEETQLNEVLSRIERMKAKVRFARTQAKRERRLQLALKMRSTTAKLNSRARRLAVNLMKQRLMRKPVNKMTVQEKERAEAIVAKRKNAINRLAMKLAPRLRKIENERLSHAKVTQ